MSREHPIPDFDALYRADDDPWEVSSSWYESRKLDVLLASLPRPHFARVWEPGCGIGVATAALAARTEALIAGDPAESAVRLARARTTHLPHVQVVRSGLPEVPFEGQVDLVVVAEFLYYVSDLAGALEAVWSTVAPGGHVAFLHWAHHPHDAFRSGPQTHAAAGLDSIDRGAIRVVAHAEPDFLLDVYENARCAG